MLACYEKALTLVKQRLNRLPGDKALDDYLYARIEAASGKLGRTGIHIDNDSVEDLIFLADYVVWQYQNRDAPGGMPEWLRLRRRERWLQEQRGRGT